MTKITIITVVTVVTVVSMVTVAIILIVIIEYYNNSYNILFFSLTIEFYLYYLYHVDSSTICNGNTLTSVRKMGMSYYTFIIIIIIIMW